MPFQGSSANLGYSSPSSKQNLSAANDISNDYDNGDDAMEFEAIERQELLNEAYDSGYSAGFEAGIRAQAAQDKERTTKDSYAEGFAAGQSTELKRVRTYLAGHNVAVPGLLPEHTPHWLQPPPQGEPVPSAQGSSSSWNLQTGSQYPRGNLPHSRSNPAQEPPKNPLWSNSIDSTHGVSRGIAEPSPAPEATMQARTGSRPRNDGDSRLMPVNCVFCGREVSSNSLLRHKKRRHPAELAAAGVELQYHPCWWPGCGMLKDNLVPNQLTTHLQRKHNFSHPGEPNAFTENIKYYSRMPRPVVIDIISDLGQELNAVKEHIKSLEAQLRTRNPAYVSRHGLPNLNHMHETRQWVLEHKLSAKALLPLAVQELRQLNRARGMRTQLRHDEGTWWEVANDLEAALNPSGALAQAVLALAPPGDGPTVNMSPGTLVEGPNMNDPSWKPRYAPLFQQEWVEPSTRDDEMDGVILPPNTTVRRTKFEIVLPSFSRPALTAQDPVEDEEEKEGFQRLMAEIEQRVVDDGSQPDDWSDNHDGTEGDEVEDDNTRYDAVSSTRPSPQPQKRPGSSIPVPDRGKRRKFVEVKRDDCDLG